MLEESTVPVEPGYVDSVYPTDTTAPAGTSHGPLR
jgi:hypothetical protein